MKFTILKLRFLAPLHLGREGMGVEDVDGFAHSDTLFSAICNVWAELYGGDDLTKLLCRFCQVGEKGEEPPFLISSAFPFVGSTYFLPKPKVGLPDISGLPEAQQQPLLKRIEKLNKDITWITTDLFSQWVHCHLPSPGPQYPSIPRDIVEVGDKDPLKEMEEHYKKHIKTEIRPRVQIERLTGAARLYFFGMVSFAEGSGLYCFVRCPDAALLDRLKIVVRALGEIGLGGERSSGYGRFTTKDAWETIELDLPGDQDANGWVTLSLYHPSDQDWSDANVVDQSLNRYKFVDRAGWVVSPSRQRPVRRKSVMMFEEGTSFKMSPLRDPDLLPNRIVGHLVDVTPEGYLQECGHCVYRYGFAFNVPAVLP